MHVDVILGAAAVSTSLELIKESPLPTTSAAASSSPASAAAYYYSMQIGGYLFAITVIVFITSPSIKNPPQMRFCSEERFKRP